MITPEYCVTMARYNAWQNQGLSAAFAALPHGELTADRGAFFGSLTGTASHLLWGDRMWMSRFDGWDAPSGGIPASARLFDDSEEWSGARADADAKILTWAKQLDEVALAGDLSWYSGAAGRHVTRPLAFCITHFFNHQTHHRGQIHGMLTQAGWQTADSDLFLMPAAPE